MALASGPSEVSWREASAESARGATADSSSRVPLLRMLRGRFLELDEYVPSVHRLSREGPRPRRG
jgi:hypothetical protein